MANGEWIPKIVYGVGPVTIDFTIGIDEPWTPAIESDPEGSGFDIAASGIPESYSVRDDNLLSLTLRFTEAELSSVIDFIKYQIDNMGAAFDLWLDKGDVATKYTVYLREPRPGDRIDFPRDQYNEVHTRDIVVTTVNGAKFLTQFNT